MNNIPYNRRVIAIQIIIIVIIVHIGSIRSRSTINTEITGARTPIVLNNRARSGTRTRKDFNLRKCILNVIQIINFLINRTLNITVIVAICKGKIIHRMRILNVAEIKIAASTRNIIIVIIIVYGGSAAYRTVDVYSAS